MKKPYQTTKDALLAAGGKYWEKAGLERIYFNKLEELIGLSVSRYKSGNISSAETDWGYISNSKARGLVVALENTKLYYDLTNGQFCCSTDGGGPFTDTQLADKLISAVIERVESAENQ
jgi:hypothetical protein